MFVLLGGMGCYTGVIALLGSGENLMMKMLFSNNLRCALYKFVIVGTRKTSLHVMQQRATVLVKQWEVFVFVLTLLTVLCASETSVLFCFG